MNDLNSLNPIMNSTPELKLPQGTDLTESLLSKVKITISLPGVVEGANGTADKGAGLPFEGNGKSGFGEQGATMQAGVQRQEPLVASSNTTSFGSIVADRLAAVAEQVGLRDKPLDITLRLKMEGGESLLVGLKDQAGKMIIQVRCADESMVSLLGVAKGDYRSSSRSEADLVDYFDQPYRRGPYQEAGQGTAKKHMGKAARAFEPVYRNFDLRGSYERSRCNRQYHQYHYTGYSIQSLRQGRVPEDPRNPASRIRTLWTP